MTHLRKVMLEELQRRNFSQATTRAYLGAVVGAINLTALFFGQRVAKDYVGAAVLVPYFLLAITGIYLLAEH